jgi:flagellar biosynthesis regulator FlaF
MSGRALLGASFIISVAALATAALVVYGNRGNGSSEAARLVAQPTPRPPSARAPARVVRNEVAARTATPVRNAGFWRLVDETRKAAGSNTERQSQLLEERLTQLKPRAIVAFARTRHRIDRQLYTWKLWGAATVIEDGCSDDCFRDFRAYIISLGHNAYERALHNPDSLAPVVRDAENGDWENADNVAPDAYSSRTGNDFPLDDSDLSGRPAGARIDLDSANLARRYPQLAARFRQT